MRTKRAPNTLMSEKMITTVGQQFAHHADHQDGPAQVHHSDVARNAHSTGYEPTSQSKTNSMSMADGDDEDQI